jgi:hypothetical protein
MRDEMYKVMAGDTPANPATPALIGSWLAVGR